MFDYGEFKEDGMLFFIDMVLCQTSLEKYLGGGVEVEVNGDNWQTICLDDVKFLETSYTMLQHVVNGLFYIHEIGEVNRDLTPHNCTITWAKKRD